MGCLDGGVAIATGGSSGIGAAACRAFAAEGDEVAQAIVFLASEERPGDVAGSELDVDGGWTAH